MFSIAQVIIKIYNQFMSCEIELKIPVSKLEYDDLLLLINKQKNIPNVKITSDVQFINKSDEYYSKYESKKERNIHKEPQVIRLRTQVIQGDSKSYFTLKRKTKENGIEFNNETETLIEDKSVLQDFFNVAGYHKYFSKIKEAFSCYCILCNYPEIEFHLELEKVNQFFYIEIEYTKEKPEPKTISHLLETLVISLGLDPQKKDSRSWLKILSQKDD